MAFKKGDRIQTDDGQAGEILFVDNRGVEAQVALQRVSLKMRTDSLRLFDPDALEPQLVIANPAKARRVSRKPKT
jgi:hypothetical protein